MNFNDYKVTWDTNTIPMKDRENALYRYNDYFFNIYFFFPNYVNSLNDQTISNIYKTIIHLQQPIIDLYLAESSSV
jgi:hypothetical protein